jgi:hypothetical protein
MGVRMELAYAGNSVIAALRRAPIKDHGQSARVGALNKGCGNKIRTTTRVNNKNGMEFNKKKALYASQRICRIEHKEAERYGIKYAARGASNSGHGTNQKRGTCTENP